MLSVLSSRCIGLLLCNEPTLATAAVGSQTGTASMRRPRPLIPCTPDDLAARRHCARPTSARSAPQRSQQS